MSRAANTRVRNIIFAKSFLSMGCMAQYRPWRASSFRVVRGHGMRERKLPSPRQHSKNLNHLYLLPARLSQPEPDQRKLMDEDGVLAWVNETPLPP